MIDEVVEKPDDAPAETARFKAKKSVLMNAMDLNGRSANRVYVHIHTSQPAFPSSFLPLPVLIDSPRAAPVFFQARR